MTMGFLIIDDTLQLKEIDKNSIIESYLKRWNIETSFKYLKNNLVLTIIVLEVLYLLNYVFSCILTISYIELVRKVYVKLVICY